jgi:hypothetical protein
MTVIKRFCDNSYKTQFLKYKNDLLNEQRQNKKTSTTILKQAHWPVSMEPVD